MKSRGNSKQEYKKEIKRKGEPGRVMACLSPTRQAQWPWMGQVSVNSPATLDRGCDVPGSLFSFLLSSPVPLVVQCIRKQLLSGSFSFFPVLYRILLCNGTERDGYSQYCMCEGLPSILAMVLLNSATAHTKEKRIEKKGFSTSEQWGGSGAIFLVHFALANGSHTLTFAFVLRAHPCAQIHHSCWPKERKRKEEGQGRQKG